MLIMCMLKAKGEVIAMSSPVMTNRSRAILMLWFLLFYVLVLIFCTVCTLCAFTYMYFS